MNTSTTVVTASTSRFTTRGFWEGLWRSAGLQSVGLFIIALMFHSHQPLLAAVISGLAVLNLMWFAAALRSTLADAGQGGWGAAATAASAAVGGLLLLLITLDAASGSAGSENTALTSAISQLGWSGFVVSSFPRAMLIMAGSFGLWRAKLLSSGLFAAGVAAVVLVLLGGTTWLNEGVWSPDGIYSRLVSPLIGFMWIALVSRVLFRSPASRAEW
jgi:hypothetical protein